jgi:predicted RNA-binding protein with EMAP domain
MPVIAMKATARAAHDQTDNLFIYTFSSPEQGDKQIVANKDNHYDVGDVAGVAVIGTFLPGLEIKPRKVFGVPSEGMAMGTVDAPLDADVSAQFDADAPERPFTVTLQVEVTARYADDTEKLARKAVKSGQGQVVSVA